MRASSLRITSTRRNASATARAVLWAGRMIADAKMDELTRTMDLERALRGKVGRVSPALAIAQKDLLGRNTRVPFWACVFPLAFGVASSS